MRMFPLPFPFCLSHLRIDHIRQTGEHVTAAFATIEANIRYKHSVLIIKASDIPPVGVLAPSPLDAASPDRLLGLGVPHDSACERRKDMG